MSASNTNPCAGDNDGNIVNVNTGECCDDRKAEPKQLVFFEKEPAAKKCCFEVFITRFWVTHNKDINPAAGMIMVGYANEQTGIAPSGATRLHAHPKHGWININQKIGSFIVSEGEKFPVLVRVDAIEWGNGLDGASDVGSDLEGDDPGQEIVLDCSSSKVAKTRLAVKLQRPKGGDAGRVAIEIAAFKKACCC